MAVGNGEDSCSATGCESTKCCVGVGACAATDGWSTIVGSTPTGISTAAASSAAAGGCDRLVSGDVPVLAGEVIINCGKPMAISTDTTKTAEKINPGFK